MESLVLKQPKDSVANHLQKVEKENQELKKKNNPPKESYINAPDHQLRNLEKHQQKLRDSPQGPLGSSHEKAQLVNNKTHYSSHDPDARISVKPGKARKLNYSFLEQKGITSWVPVSGMYKPAVPGFIYNNESDEYTCPVGKPLPFKDFDYTADGRLLKNYWAAAKDCNSCPVKPSCVPNVPCRKITRTPYDEQ